MGCMSSQEAREQGIETGPGHGPVVGGRHMFTPPSRRGPRGAAGMAGGQPGGMSIGAQMGAGIGPGTGVGGGGGGGAGPP